MLETIRYRVGQFFRALVARASDEEIDQAIGALTPQAQALFRRQARQDQRHAMEVYQALVRAGETDPDLLAAALLHDVGKAAAWLPPWRRAVVVLLDRLAPRLLARWSAGEARGWRRPWVVHARHPEIGACWAQEAGCSPLTVALIRRHQDEVTGGQREEDRLLAVLQAVDNVQ